MPRAALLSQATILIALVIVACPLFANMYTSRGDGVTIAPLQSEHISMVSEAVLVEARAIPGEDTSDLRVTAIYKLRNTLDQPLRCEVAFPFETRSHAAKARDSFKVVMSDDPAAASVAAELRTEADARERGYGFDTAYVWPVLWEPGETKTVRIDYVMGEPVRFAGLVEGFRISYIVRTGAYWKGPIGHATFTFKLGTPDKPGFGFFYRDYSDLLKTPYSYPENVVLKTDEEIRWEFHNWTPHEDVWAGWLRWVGSNDTWRDGWKRMIYVQTPNPYVGSAICYTDALLEELVDNHLRPWIALFPLEAKRDREGIKAFVAEWLYREIFARNGDPFVIGEANQDRSGYPAFVSELNGRFSQSSGDFRRWSDRFPAEASIRVRNGWYRPATGRGLRGTVLIEDLTAQERANLDFLLPYFAVPQRAP